MAKNKTLYDQLRRKEALFAAWQRVLSNGLKSESKITRRNIRNFQLKERQQIDRICRALQKRKFVFDNNRGIAPKKKNKASVRPLVLIPIESRIVQRSILDVLQQQPAIEKYLKVPSSFGAIAKRGIPDAIAAAEKETRSGDKFFIKSDIKSFFTKIPIESVLEIIRKDIKEDEFLDFLVRAIKLEVEVLSDYKKHSSFFDYDEQGTPQGCCLSPLFGNILLYEFDAEMNQGDITCLRYLDDFIIFAPNEKAANAAFRRAQKLLSKYKLDAYDPLKDIDKAGKGTTKSKFEYLGVEFDNGILRPSSKNRKKIIVEIKELISESDGADFNAEQRPDEDFSMTHTLYEIHNKLKGWGNQYFYCNDRAAMGSLDKEISDLLEQYVASSQQKMISLEKKGKGWQKSRRLLGVHLLLDSKTLPSKGAVLPLKAVISKDSSSLANTNDEMPF